MTDTVKFLLIRFSSIGDIVLTTPVIRCLKNQVEGAEIHFLTKPAYAGILAPNPYIDKLHLLDDHFNNTVRELEQESFDYIIDLHHSLRSWKVKSRLHRISFSVNKLNVQKCLKVRFKIDRLPDIHIVDRYLDTVRLFDVQNDQKGLDYFIPPEEEVNTESLPSFLHNGYVAVVMGARHVTKQIPVERLIGVCRNLKKPVVLLGDKGDLAKANRIAAEPGIQAFNACGKYSISQSASVVQHALAVITPDTGLMHIASALKKDVISIWGNTIPGFGMSPYMPGSHSRIFEVKNLSCRPCSKLGYKTCPKKHFRCMNDIPWNELTDYVNGLITA